MKRKVILIFLAIVASLFQLNPIYAGGCWVEKEVDITHIPINGTAVFSHNSNGYWQCSNAKIYDNSINYTLGYGSCTGNVSFTYNLPSSVVSALKNGSVKVYLENPGELSCVDFNKFSYSFNGLSSISYSLSFFPRFAPSYTLNRFVKGISGTIPLVESPYGKNLYTVYRYGTAYTASGYFASSNPNQTKEQYLHPSQIIDSQGNILNSTVLNLNGKIYSGNICRVGNGDFQNRGSVYLEFSCPIILRFTTIVSEYISDGNSSGGSAGGSNIEEPKKEDPIVEPSFNKQIHRFR